VPPAQRLESELKEVRDRIAWRTRGGKGNPAPQAASSLLPPSDDATAVLAGGPGSVAVGEGEGLDDGGSLEENDTSSGSAESESEGDVGELVSTVATQAGSLSFGEDSGHSNQGAAVSDGRASVEDVVPLLQPPPQVAVPSDK
jgi:hypothetical protein